MTGTTILAGNVFSGPGKTVLNSPVWTFFRTHPQRRSVPEGFRGCLMHDHYQSYLTVPTSPLTFSRPRAGLRAYLGRYAQPTKRILVLKPR